MPQLITVNPNAETSVPVSETDSGVSIGDIFRTLRSRIPLILTCSAICVLCSVVYLLVTKPTFEASATIRIDPGRAGSLGLNDLTNPGNADGDAGLHTEIAVLKSDGVALRTLQSLSDQTFLSYTGVTKAAAALPANSDALSVSQQGILNLLEGNTDAKQVEGTSLINVTVRASDPSVAANLVNNLVKAYTVQSFTSRDNSVAELRTWLSAQMATLKNQVDTSQKKLSDFQEANNIIGTDGTSNTITDRLRILNQSLATAQADRIEREARLRAASTGDPAALATLFPNPSLNAMQAAQGELQGRAAQLSAKFGPKYPPLIELNKQLAAVDLAVNNTVATVKNRLQQEYDSAKRNQDMLQAQYDAQTHIAYGINRNQAEYAVLQADVTSSRELYDTLRRKLQQASVDADVNGVNTVLVDSARVPTIPVAPKKLLILLGSAILGLFAGIAAAFLSEASSDKLRTVGQLEKEFGFYVMGVLPRELGASGSSGAETKSLATTSGSLITLQKPASKNAEAYRNVRNAILLSFPRAHSKKLLITSALPGEGASRVAANLAVSLAQAGHRVLIVDADLRSPALHHEFGVENTVGLSDYLQGPTQPGRLSQPLKNLTNLCLLTAGASVALPSEKLASESFHSALEQWESQFDFIVIQAAPMLVVSDSLFLASLTDAVLLVTRFGVTRLRTLNQVQAMLARTGARVAGVLVDDVPLSSIETESYGRVGNAYFA